MGYEEDKKKYGAGKAREMEKSRGSGTLEKSAAKEKPALKTSGKEVSRGGGGFEKPASQTGGGFEKTAGSIAEVASRLAGGRLKKLKFRKPKSGRDYTHDGTGVHRKVNMA